jgi:hypothetical protein
MNCSPRVAVTRPNGWGYRWDGFAARRVDQTREGNVDPAATEPALAAEMSLDVPRVLGRASDAVPPASVDPASLPRQGAAIALRQATRRVLRRGKYWVGDRPALLPLLLRATPEGVTKAITDDTVLVIEGFPRSGNTFALFAFRNAQGPGVNSVGHVHHPAQVIAAARLGLPTLLVIRPPVPCLASYLVTAPHGRPAGVLREYIHYHTALLPYRGAVVVGEFEQVTTSFSKVIEALNLRFGTSFAPFDESVTNVEAVFGDIERHHAAMHPRKAVERVVPRPSSERKLENAHYAALLEAPELAELRARAEDLYQVFVSGNTPR